MLNVNNLTKKFNGQTAVDAVSFKIEPGEIFALIGPNGSGKTTIVKTIAGLLQPTAGEIIVGGLNAAKDPLRTKAQIGYIPDEPTVWSGLTGREFLRFSGALYSVPENEREEGLAPWLKVFDLEDIADGYFEDYSRGNKQKFAILAAFLHKPKLLLIDEPIVGLDPTSASIAQREFKRFAEEGGAVLLVTHTLSVAVEIADRIGILNQGRLTDVGALSELKARAGLGGEARLDDVYRALVK
jgi:ABC-2 type transport system ATP-binding protein